MPIVKHSSRQLTLKQFPRLHSPEKISSMNYSHNEIRAIQSNIALSCNLMYIDISYNLIVRIDNLALLPNLLSVDVSHNRICDVPECMIALKKLEIFDLSFNRINSIYQIRVLKEMMNKREGKLRVSIEGNEIIKVKNNWELLGRWFSFNQKD